MNKNQNNISQDEKQNNIFQNNNYNHLHHRSITNQKHSQNSQNILEQQQLRSLSNQQQNQQKQQANFGYFSAQKQKIITEKEDNKKQYYQQNQNLNTLPKDCNDQVQKVGKNKNAPNNFIVKKLPCLYDQSQQNLTKKEVESNQRKENYTFQSNKQQSDSQHIKLEYQNNNNNNNLSQQNKLQHSNNQQEQNKRNLNSELNQTIKKKTQQDIQNQQLQLKNGTYNLIQINQENKIPESEKKQIYNSDKLKSNLNSQNIQTQQQNNIQNANINEYKQTNQCDSIQNQQISNYSNSKIQQNQDKQMQIQKPQNGNSNFTLDNSKIYQISNSQNQFQQYQSKNQIKDQIQKINSIDQDNENRQDKYSIQNIQQNLQSGIKNLSQNQQKSEKIEQIENVPNFKKIGLPNIGQTCYINSAVQTLRQIYYFDKNIFDSSDYANGFILLFQMMENENTNTLKIKSCMEIIFFKSKENQSHYNGGDAFLSLCNFLIEIKNHLPANKRDQFDANFSRKYQDQLCCSVCNNPIPNTDETLSCFPYEEFGCECNYLEEAFQEIGDLDLFLSANSEIKCKQKQCKREKFFATREYLLAPNFMLIKLLNCLKRKECSQILNKKFDYPLKDQDKYYQIIGFCNYLGNHYTYTAKYNNIWIEFNDSQARQTKPDCSKAIYFLLKKL
ncbi:hypothetical protein ABPG72_002721 [Tetrahymena utriculariae]